MVSVTVTAIRLSQNGSKHEHIAHLWWVGRENGLPGNGPRSEVVVFIERGGKAYVSDDYGHLVGVHVVEPTDGPKYVQTRADGIWTDNLLSLPRR
jgi:hypothetical protein